jgi:phenylalanyl-tRNA synthetase alpha chain
VDQVQKNLKALSKDVTVNVDAATVNDYKKRKLMQQVTLTSFKISKGSHFTTTIEKPETDLTPEMMASGDWRTRKFKPINFNALGVPVTCGHLHPLLKVSLHIILTSYIT